jgi:hypothetical protein
MPKPRRLLVLAALALISSILLLAQPASASPPTVETFHDEGEFEFADCGTFQLNETFTVDVRVITFYNAEGDPVRVAEHVNFVGVITNSASGNTYPDPGHHQFVTDLTTGETTVVGVVFNTPVPGLGPVLHDAGKIVIDENGEATFVGGPHTVFFGTNPDPCTVLL